MGPARTTQVEPLSSPGWGGRRPGAGRKPGPDPAEPHREREEFDTLPAHAVYRLHPDVPSLRNAAVVREVARTFAVGCERPGFRLVHWSIQRNSVHLIIEARDKVALRGGFGSIASRLARAANRALGRRGRVLPERYKLRLLRTPKAVHGALRKVLLYPRRHTGLGDPTGAGIDPASSGRWFDGWRPGSAAAAVYAATVASDEPRPVARARTRLLATEWRRHGLLHPDEDGPPETEKRRPG